MNSGQGNKIGNNLKASFYKSMGWRLPENLDGSTEALLASHRREDGQPDHLTHTVVDTSYTGNRAPNGSGSSYDDYLDPSYNPDETSEGTQALDMGRTSSTSRYVQNDSNHATLLFNCYAAMNQCWQYTGTNCLKPSLKASNNFLKGAAYYTYKGISYAEAITSENIDALRWYSSIVIIELSIALFYEIYSLSFDYERGKQDYNQETNHDTAQEASFPALLAQLSGHYIKESADLAISYLLDGEKNTVEAPTFRFNHTSSLTQAMVDEAIAIADAAQNITTKGVTSIPIDTGDLNAAWDEVIDSAMNDWQDSTFTIDGTPPAPIDSALIVILPFMAAGACYKWGLSIPTLPYLENAPIHLLEPGNTKVTTSIGLIPALVIGFLYLPPMEFNVITSVLVFTAAGILALRALLALYNVIAEKLDRKDMIIKLGSTQAVSPEESSITTTASKAIQLSIPTQIAFFIGAGGYIADKYIDNYFDAYDVMKQALLPVYGPKLAPQYIRLCIEYAFQIFNYEFWHDIYSQNKATAIGVIFLPTIVIFGAIFVAKLFKSLAECKLTPEQIQAIRAEVIDFTNKHFRHNATTPPSRQHIELAFIKADCYDLLEEIHELEHKRRVEQSALDSDECKGDSIDAIRNRAEIKNKIKALDITLRIKRTALQTKQEELRSKQPSKKHSDGETAHSRASLDSAEEGRSIHDSSEGSSDTSNSTDSFTEETKTYHGTRLKQGSGLVKKVARITSMSSSAINIGLVAHKVNGDGNCLFAALAAVEDKGRSFVEMRANIVQIMQDNPTQFNDQTLNGNREAYLGKMAQNGTWGGHAEIAAAAEIMKIEVVIFHENGNPIRVEPISETAKVTAQNRYPIYLSWNGTHYEYFTLKEGESAASIENQIAKITTQQDGEPRTYLTFSQADNSFTLLNQEGHDLAQAQARSKYQKIISKSIAEIEQEQKTVQKFTSSTDEPIAPLLNGILTEARELQQLGARASSSSDDENAGTLVNLAQYATEVMSLAFIAKTLVIEYLFNKILVLLEGPFTEKQAICLDGAKNIFYNADLGQTEKKRALTNILRTALDETEFANKLLTASHQLSAIKTHAKQSDNNALEQESLEKTSALNEIIMESEQTIEQRQHRLTPITAWIAAVSTEQIALLLRTARELATDNEALIAEINNLAGCDNIATTITGLALFIAKNSLETENGEANRDAILNLIHHEGMKNIARSVYTANNQRSVNAEATCPRASVKRLASQATVSRKTKQQQFNQFLLSLSNALNKDLVRRTIPPQEAFIVYQLIMECKQGEENSAVLTGLAKDSQENIMRHFTEGFYRLNDFQIDQAYYLADKRKAPEEMTSTMGGSSSMFQPQTTHITDIPPPPPPSLNLGSAGGNN